jgi:hypothetical protein
MGQDSEEAAEFVATVRGDHVVMKTWYAASSHSETLRQKYGPYPSLWKEVLNWPGWKEARKEYLKSTQTQQSPSSSGSAPQGVNIKIEEDAGSIPRKRKSRWGKASNDDDIKSESNNNNDSNCDNAPRTKRWGHADNGHGHVNGPSSSGGQGQYHGHGQHHAVVLPPPPAPPVPGLVLPGMPSIANLPPQQQEEMRRMQARLREINDKMSNLDPEAARVDALPRGHRERSASPPPGTYRAVQ